MLSPHVFARARRRLGIIRVGLSLGVFLLACLAFVWMRHGPLFLNVLAIFVVGLLGIRLHKVVRRELDDSVTSGRERWVMIGLVVLLGGVLLLAWFVRIGPDGAGFFGLALLYVALGIGIQELRSWRALSGRLTFVVFGGSVGLAAVALIAMGLGVRSALWFALVAGGIGTPLGLSLVSEQISRLLDERPTRVSLILGALGLLLLVISLSFIAFNDVDATFVVLIGVALLFLMLGIAARSSVDVVFVIATAAVVWTLGQRSVPVPNSLNPGPDHEVVVAMGDSFISGEGADAFFEGTNEQGVNTCRRAPTAYPVLLLQEKQIDVPARLSFLACSGAVAAHITDGDSSQLAQLVRTLGPPDDDLTRVLLSIGGNDALFGTIAQTCLLPIDCTRLRAAWTRHLSDVGRTLDTTYGEIRRMLPDIRVHVVPYPVPIAPKRCRWSAFSQREHVFLNDFTQDLNETVAGAASRAGFSVVETMPQALTGLRLCDGRPGDAGVNFLAANSVFGTLEQSLNPLNWIHNSLHPNTRGHEAMRSTLVAWLEQTPDAAPTASPDAPPAESPQPAVDTNEPCATTDDLQTCTSDWMLRESARFVLLRGWVFAPALIGAWLLALQILRFWRAYFAEPQD